MKRRGFEEIVAEVLDGLPEDFAEKLENVQVTIETRPTSGDLRATGLPDGSALLGLYHGVPQPVRGMGYMLVLPDKISIYKEPIENFCRRTGTPVDEMIRKVVLHEIAHHFGIKDSRLRELGY